MPKYVPFNDDLCLVEQELKVKKTVIKKEPINHIWIYDRSGSMSWALPELTKQLITLSKTIEKGNSISLGWFSSEGQFNWVFKGFKITEKSDYKALENAIKSNSTSLGCTCFSEILNDTDKVIGDLSVLSKTFALHFFTDGCPVVSNYQKEISSIFSAIKKIKGRIHTGMFIGYGSYFNKELLSQMAEKMGAMLITANQLPEYSTSITKLIQLCDNSEPREAVDPLVSKPLSIFTVSDQGAVIYSIDEDGSIYVNPPTNGVTRVYYISKEKPNKKSWDKVEISDIDFGDTKNPLAQAIYAATLVMTQQTKTDVALEMIGKVGDKAIVDALNNAFTLDEYAAAENLIGAAVLDNGARFIAGRDPNYLPKADAFCVFNLLNILMEDKAAAFFPYHPKFSYEKIGVATKSKDGFSKFTANPTSKCPFTNLTWHESRLNLSVLARVDGTIELQDKNGKSAKDFGFSNPYPTFVFRNYTFIKDGRVHTKKFYITSSKETYGTLKNQGLICDDTFKTDGVYGVDISKLPAINRAIADGKTSATDLSKKALTEHKLKGVVKALKWLRDEEVPEDEKAPESFADEQVIFLKENGILTERGGIFQPQTEKEDPKDFYMAKYFDIKLSGIATLPPVKKIAEKIASNKPRTPAEVLIEEGLKIWDSKKAGMKDKKAKSEWFDKTIVDKQKEMKEIRQILQQTKFAILLGKKWFDEFSSRENCELTVDGVKCVFDLGEERVPY
jgi:hypothetical protein